MHALAVGTEISKGITERIGIFAIRGKKKDAQITYENNEFMFAKGFVMLK